MSASKIASLAGLVAGTVWGALALVSWGSDESSLAEDELWMVGVVGFVIASGLVGYAVVDHAPMWLRLIVTASAGALGYGLIAAVTSMSSNRTYIAAGLGPLVILASLAGLLAPDRRGKKPDKPGGGHRAAR